MQETVIIHDSFTIEKEGFNFSFLFARINIINKKYKKHFFVVNHSDGRIENIEYDTGNIEPGTQEREAARLKRSNEFQKLLHRFQKDNYQVNPKYISLFIDRKTDKIILQRTQKAWYPFWPEGSEFSDTSKPAQQ